MKSGPVFTDKIARDGCKYMDNLHKIAIIAFFAAFIFYGCSAENSKYEVKTLQLTPAMAALSPLETAQFTCKAVYSDSAVRDFNPRWSVSDPSIGSISDKGLFKAANVPSAEGFIRATYGSIIATAEIDINTLTATPSVTAPIAPQNITFSNITPYSLQISWSDCSADGYVVSTGGDANADRATFEAVSNTADINSLGSNIQYYFKVKAYRNGSGGRVYGAFSPVFSANTADYPLKYSISGNKILDDKGNEMVFRGVNILDPADMDFNYDKVNDGYFSNIAAWKAKIIRIPVHPAYYKYYGSARYLALLDKVLDLAAKYKLYAIIDLHSIGFPPSGTYMDLHDSGMPFSGSIYAYTGQDLSSFWSDIAGHYKNDNRVVFYELFNEPTAEAGATLQKSWDDWKTMAENMIDNIRSVDNDAKIIVGGLNYAYDLEYAAAAPVNRPNIVYATHPYPNELITWDTGFGNLKASYPVFATEFGYDPSAADGINYKATDQYGNEIISYLEAKKISWTVWNFSPIYDPKLLSDWSYNATSSGAVFKNYLLSLN